MGLLLADLDASRACRELLYEEGLSAEEIGVGRPGHYTFYFEQGGRVVGFFTLRVEHDLLYVVHFVARKASGVRLAQRLKMVLRDMRAKRAILNVRAGQPRILAVMRRMFHAEPYAEKDGHIFLMMEVDHG